MLAFQGLAVLLCLATVFGIQGPRNPEEGDAFEGDMMLSPDQLSAIQEQVQGKNAFAAIRTGLWKTNGANDVIKYFIESAVIKFERNIKLAIADYEQYTCMRFKQVSSKPSGPHISFYSGSGCTSPVGKQTYRRNTISLGNGCGGKGTIIHEIGHSIGLYHEQSRPDRDQYVIINYQNIQDKYKFAFNKYGKNRINSRGSPYDLDSIMHYGQRYFSKNRQLTIQTKDPKDQHRIGSRNGFSKIDIEQINKMYCDGKPIPTARPNCQDNNSNCQHWGTYCTSHAYVIKNCKKTCNTC